MMSILLPVVAVWIVIVGVAASLLLFRRLSDIQLIALAVVACVVGWAFVPVLRGLPESIGLYFFIMGLWLVAGIVASSFIGNAVRFVQTRRWKALVGLVLSMTAAFVFCASLQPL